MNGINACRPSRRAHGASVGTGGHVAQAFSTGAVQPVLLRASKPPPRKRCASTSSSKRDPDSVHSGSRRRPVNADRDTATGGGKSWDSWESGRRDAGHGRRDGDSRVGGRASPRDAALAHPNRRSSRAGRPRPDEPPGVLELNHELRDAKSIQQLLQALRNHTTDALTAFNVATAWVRLGNLQSRRPYAKAPAAAVREEDGGSDGAEGACAAAVRHLLQPTAAAAPDMGVRQVANTLWGMAKVGDGLIRSAHTRDSGLPATVAADEVLARLQQRTVVLLGQPRQSGSSTGGRSEAGDQRTRQLLDQRDATQLWYGMAGLPKLTWGEEVRAALEEATLVALEAGMARTAPLNIEGLGGAGGGRGGGHSGQNGSGWRENPTAVAQIIFRIATVSGTKMNEGHKGRLATIIDAMSFDADAPEARVSSPLENPDCLLVATHLLRLDLPPAAVRRLHDMTLALPPAAAARSGRTAMARALNSSTQLGLQPSAAQARRWQQRLLEELDGPREGDWTSEGLSWTMLALSNVKAYLPDEAVRDQLLRALRTVVRQMRANDATRVQNAMKVWGLRLPEREAALLRQKASGQAWGDPRDGSGGGGNGGGRGGHGYGSWGFAR